MQGRGRANNVAPVAAFFRDHFTFCLTVYDDRRGQREGEEHDKILCFHPSTAPLTTQSAIVGLAQALTSFSSSFTQGEREPFQVLEAGQNQWMIVEVEPHVWLLMVSSRSWLGLGSCHSALRSWLVGLHASYHLLHGPISAALAADPTGALARASLQPLAQEAGRLLTPPGRSPPSPRAAPSPGKGQAGDSTRRQELAGGAGQGEGEGAQSGFTSSLVSLSRGGAKGSSRGRTAEEAASSSKEAKPGQATAAQGSGRPRPPAPWGSLTREASLLGNPLGLHQGLPWLLLPPHTDLSAQCLGLQLLATRSPLAPCREGMGPPLPADKDAGMGTQQGGCRPAVRGVALLWHGLPLWSSLGRQDTAALHCWARRALLPAMGSTPKAPNKLLEALTNSGLARPASSRAQQPRGTRVATLLSPLQWRPLPLTHLHSLQRTPPLSQSTPTTPTTSTTQSSHHRSSSQQEARCGVQREPGQVVGAAGAAGGRGLRRTPQSYEALTTLGGAAAATPPGPQGAGGPGTAAFLLPPPTAPAVPPLTNPATAPCNTGQGQGQGAGLLIPLLANLVTTPVQAQAAPSRPGDAQVAAGAEGPGPHLAGAAGLAVQAGKQQGGLRQSTGQQGQGQGQHGQQGPGEGGGGCSAEAGVRQQHAILQPAGVAAGVAAAAAEEPARQAARGPEGGRDGDEGGGAAGGGLPLEGEQAVPCAQLWLQELGEQVVVLPLFLGPLLLLLLLEGGAQPTPQALAPYVQALSWQGPHLVQQLQSAAPSPDCWHQPGYRYCLWNEAAYAGRASPAKKVSTLGPSTLRLAARALNWLDGLEARRLMQCDQDDLSEQAGTKLAHAASGKQDAAGVEASRPGAPLRPPPSPASFTGCENYEIALRNGNDGWVVCRRAGEQRLLVALEQAPVMPTLPSISSHVSKLTSSLAPGYFEGFE